MRWAKEWTERERLFEAFWTSLLERCRARTSLYATHGPGHSQELRAASVVPSVALRYSITDTAAWVEVCIDRHPRERSKAAFDSLWRERVAIERDMGTPLEWQRQDDRVRSRMGRRFSACLGARETWPALQDAMTETMIRLDRVLSERLAHLDD